MGSNPNGAATHLAASAPLQPLRDLLVSVGEAVANLNTVIVGLDAIENGYNKPEALNISWNPSCRITAARKSRRFAVEAVLVRVTEALCEFVLATAQLPRFDGVRRSWTEGSRAEQLADLATNVLESESYLTAGAVLLVHWRNRVVHVRSRASLTPQQKRCLQNSAAEIEARYAGLSVARLLADFDADLPTLKDISSLISMAIRLAREIDKAANRLSRDDLSALLTYYGLTARIDQIVAQTTPAKQQDSIVRLLQSTAPGLVSAYREHHYPVGRG